MEKASNRPNLLLRSACLAFVLALVLAGFGDALHHAHEGPLVEPTDADCVVDHEFHESPEHLTPIDEPHVETEGAAHEHGCVGCHGSRTRVAVANGGVRSPVPERAERASLGHVRADAGDDERLPAPRGPPCFAIS